jgi:hypothetical protein
MQLLKKPIHKLKRKVRDRKLLRQYGFTAMDAWNFCEWYPRVGAYALKYLALHNTCYPSGWTYEEWNKYLNYLAKRLERCVASQQIDFERDRNEYANEFDFVLEKKRIHTGGCTKILELTPEEEELRQKYFAREREIHDADIAYDIETYKWLAEDLRRMWD